MEPYKYEFRYSQISVVVDVVSGALVLLACIGLAFWSRNWLVIIFLPAGGFVLWKAFSRGRDKGVQLKFGKQGVWTAKTGALKWSEATLKMEEPVTDNVSVIKYVVVLKRYQHNQVLARFCVDDLDVDPRSFPYYIKEFARK